MIVLAEEVLKMIVVGVSESLMISQLEAYFIESSTTSSVEAALVMYTHYGSLFHTSTKPEFQTSPRVAYSLRLTSTVIETKSQTSD